MSLLEQAISELQSETRATLYLNEQRIRKAYDSIGVGHQLTLSDQLTRGGELGVLSFFKGKLENASGHQALMLISDRPELMAIMVETRNKIDGQVLELHKEGFRRNTEFIKYVGESRLVKRNQDVTAETTGLPDSLARTVKEQRIAQQNEASEWDDEQEKEPETIVWTAAGKPALSSIVPHEGAKEFKNNWMSFHHLENPKGILGTFETEKDGIVFLTALWIWRVVYTT